MVLTMVISEYTKFANSIKESLVALLGDAYKGQSQYLIIKDLR